MSRHCSTLALRWEQRSAPGPPAGRPPPLRPPLMHMTPNMARSTPPPPKSHLNIITRSAISILVPIGGVYCAIRARSERTMQIDLHRNCKQKRYLHRSCAKPIKLFDPHCFRPLQTSRPGWSGKRNKLGQSTRCGKRFDGQRRHVVAAMGAFKPVLYARSRIRCCRRSSTRVLAHRF
jgi:hypothetical protein